MTSSLMKAALAGIVALAFAAYGTAQAKPSSCPARGGGIASAIKYQVDLMKGAGSTTLRGLKSIRTPKPFKQWIKSEPKAAAIYKAQKKANSSLTDKALAVGGAAGLVGTAAWAVTGNPGAGNIFNVGWVSGFSAFAGATLHGLKMANARDATIKAAVLDPNIPDPPPEVTGPYYKEHPMVKLRRDMIAAGKLPPPK